MATKVAWCVNLKRLLKSHHASDAKLSIKDALDLYNKFCTAEDTTVDRDYVDKVQKRVAKVAGHDLKWTDVGTDKDPVRALDSDPKLLKACETYLAHRVRITTPPPPPPTMDVNTVLPRLVKSHMLLTKKVQSMASWMNNIADRLERLDPTSCNLLDQEEEEDQGAPEPELEPELEQEAKKRAQPFRELMALGAFEHTTKRTRRT